jgi:hypothetical protein
MKSVVQNNVHDLSRSIGRAGAPKPRGTHRPAAQNLFIRLKYGIFSSKARVSEDFFEIQFGNRRIELYLGTWKPREDAKSVNLA